jgi:hypothetical protein
MGAFYYTGFLLEANSNGVTKQFNIRDSDSNNLQPFVGGPSANNINHARQSQVEYAFSTPFVGHLLRYEPGNDNVQCQIFGVEWHGERWPELSVESTVWFNCGTAGAKYMRGRVIVVDTGGQNITLTLKSSDGFLFTLPAIQTVSGVKTPVGFAINVPFIAHEMQILKSGPCRIWLDECIWDFDPWPELTQEATGWLPVLPGGAAAFLQGLLIPVEAAGAVLSLSIFTDTSPTPIALTPIRQPIANVKTPVPYSLNQPVVCHQAQLIPNLGCRLWTQEIQWFAEATPELAFTWASQLTSHGMSGYHSIYRIEASYTAQSTVSLVINAFDGTAPVAMVLPATGGAKQRVLMTPTFNKALLFSYFASSAQPAQLFNEFIVWVIPWGRSGPAVPYKVLGGAFDDKVAI